MHLNAALSHFHLQGLKAPLHALNGTTCRVQETQEYSSSSDSELLDYAENILSRSRGSSDSEASSSGSEVSLSYNCLYEAPQSIISTYCILLPECKQNASKGPAEEDKRDLVTSHLVGHSLETFVAV